MGSYIAALPAYASEPKAIVENLLARTGWLKLVMLALWLISAWLVARGPGSARKLLFGIVLLTFFALQGVSIVNSFRNTNLYQPREIMTLSDLEIVENVYNSREFSGRNALSLIVADYMPRAKVFLYDDNMYSKQLLAWSGRNPDSTFQVGGYRATMDASFKAGCLRRPHVIYKGRSDAPLYVATPLSTYTKEERIYLMTDGSIDYLIPGSWQKS